jgi:hypothetical protein
MARINLFSIKFVQSLICYAANFTSICGSLWAISFSMVSCRLKKSNTSLGMLQFSLTFLNIVIIFWKVHNKIILWFDKNILPWKSYILLEVTMNRSKVNECGCFRINFCLQMNLTTSSLCYTLSRDIWKQIQPVNIGFMSITFF